MLRAHGITDVGIARCSGKLPAHYNPRNNTIFLSATVYDAATVAAVAVHDLSVVTSGDYERYFEQDGVRYHHIFDPETGYPAASGLRSVTVIDENSTRADALTTALFVMGADKGRAYCEKNGIAAVFITSDRQVFTTEKVSELCSFSFTGEDKGYTYAQ